MRGRMSTDASQNFELADAYLAHLEAGGRTSPESFLEERGVSSTAALELLRTLASIEGESGRLPIAGEQVGPYRIGERIGQGGMGVVFRARDERLGRPVALKVCRRAQLGEQGAVRFRREAQALAALDHPHIVQVFDVGESDQFLYYVMQLIEGRTLEDLISDGPWGLPFQEIASRFASVAEALGEAHEAGIVHRDVKPANLLIGDHDRLVLADFGVVRWDGFDALTETSDLPGTPPYMAPEQIQGEAAGPHSDQYALAAVLYQALTGEWLLRELPLRDLLQSRARLEIPPPTHIREDIPAELEAIVLRGIALDPSARFPDVASLARALRAAAAGPADVTSWHGRELGPYRLAERIGTGGMGTVYRAHDTRDEREVAVKLLHPHRLGGRGALDRVLREVTAGAAIEHPHVLRTIGGDVIAVDGQTVCYVAMEYVPGRTLRQLLSDVGPLPEGLLRELAHQAALGLAAIHDHGVVHRDIKPDNLMIDEAQALRIMDLGIVAFAGDITSSGFLGSLRYAAPEQIEGERIDPRADLYALGITLYEMAAGRPPYQASDPRRLMRMQLEDPLPMPVREDEPLSPFMDALLRTLTSKDAARRFDSAALVAEITARGEEHPWWQERQADDAAIAGAWPDVRVRRTTPLVGRERELALLDARLQAAHAGTGAIVVLEGEPGIGKTRLVDAFLRTGRVPGVRALYASLADEDGLAPFFTSVQAHLGGNTSTSLIARWLEEVPALAPGLAAAIRVRSADDGAAPLEPPAMRRAVRHLVEAWARERPTIWIIDDVHEADEGAKAMIEGLARVAARAPLVLVLTAVAGAERVLRDVSHLAQTKKLSLSRLDSDDVHAIVESTFGKSGLVAALAPRIEAVSAGVPFVIVECLQGMIERGDVEQTPGGSWRARTAIDAIEMPEAVQTLIAGRLQELDPMERQVLELGAVQGRVFDPDLVARAMGVTRLWVLQTLVHLERRTGLVRSLRQGVRLDAPHVRDVLYRELGDALRGESHTSLADARIARATERGDDALEGDDAVFVASHHVRGREPHDALPHLDAAIAFLRQSGRVPEAAALVEDALARLDDAPAKTRIRLRLRLVECLIEIGEMDRAEALLREAIESEGPSSGPPDMLRLRRMNAAWLVRGGRLREAKAWAEEALDLAKALDDPRHEAHCHTLLAMAAATMDGPGIAREHAAAALVCAERTGDVHDLVHALSHLARICARTGETDDGIGFAARALEHCRSRPGSLLEGTANEALATCRFVMGDVDGAREAAEAAVRVASVFGHHRLMADALATLARCTKEGDDAEATRSALEDVVARRRTIVDRTALAFDLLSSMDAALLRDDMDAVRAHAEEALAIARATEADPIMAFATIGACRAMPDMAPSAREAFDTHHTSLGVPRRLRAAVWLLDASGDARYLEIARTLRDTLIANAPAAARDQLPTSLRVLRRLEQETGQK